MAVRIILKESFQVTPDEFTVQYGTVEVESKELEKEILDGKYVVGGEVVEKKQPKGEENGN